MKALSIRQPWAWLIVNGHKDIENRSWATNYRGPFYVHASKAESKADYWRAQALAKKLGVTLPAFRELRRGGIVGAAHLVDCVDKSNSPWFEGPNGFVLTKSMEIPFYPCRGQLSFFSVPDMEHQPQTASGDGYIEIPQFLRRRND